LRFVARWHGSSTLLGSVMPRFGLALVVVFALGCHTGRTPELRVLGAHQTARSEVVFVQVTNPASRPMRLTKLQYTFAADGATVAQGVVPLERDVPAGAAAVIEVPLDTEASGPMTLRGRLTAELDQAIRTFDVDAQIQPH
jgi:hypothetical protein